MMAKASVRTLELTSADGTRLHASLFPAEEPVAGLVMVHGMQSHAGWFEAAGTADQLAAAGITCLAYDRRGSGRSGGTPGHTARPDDMLADLDAARSGLRRARTKISIIGFDGPGAGLNAAIAVPQGVFGFPVLHMAIGKQVIEAAQMIGALVVVPGVIGDVDQMMEGQLDVLRFEGSLQHVAPTRHPQRCSKTCNHCRKKKDGLSSSKQLTHRGYPLSMMRHPLHPCCGSPRKL